MLISIGITITFKILAVLLKKNPVLINCPYFLSSLVTVEFSMAKLES